MYLLVIPGLFGQEVPIVPAGGSQSTSGFGINAIISHTPQEKDLSDTGGQEEIDKFELYFDWDWLRMGFNMTHAALSFTAYNQTWNTRMTKDTTYAAYRISSAGGQSKWDLFMLAGLAYTQASLSIDSVGSHASSGLGYVAGGGIFYLMNGLSVGLEMLVISTNGDFDGIKIATGSTQVLSGFKYGF